MAEPFAVQVAGVTLTIGVAYTTIEAESFNGLSQPNSL